MGSSEWLRGRVDALRRPEYTGENRCWPCTVVNAVLVAVVGIALLFVDRLLGVLVLLVGGALVALRGYVVPGTPRFAPKLVALLPVDVGTAAPDRVRSGSLAPDGVGSESLALDVDPEAVLSTLVDAGVLVVGADELFLDESFRDAWEERMAALRARGGRELADRAAAASPAAADGQRHGDRILVAGERDVWLSEAVAIAETAAVETLAEWDVPEHVRAPAAEPLRTFVRTCPVCAGPIRETTLRNCCGGPGSAHRVPERAVLACADCDTAVFEFVEGPVPGAE